MKSRVILKMLSKRGGNNKLLISRINVAVILTQVSHRCKLLEVTSDCNLCAVDAIKIYVLHFPALETSQLV